MIKFNNAAVALATAILRDYLNGTINFFASRKAVKSELTKLTPADFKNVRANLLNLGFKSEFIDKNAAELSEILRSILAAQAPSAKRLPHRCLHQRKRRRARANRKGKRAVKKEIYQKRVA